MPPLPLISRKVLFGNPDKAAVRISPDGKHISYLSPLEGVLNVWVAPRDDLATARAVTHDKGRGIRFYAWAFSNNHILFIQDKNGDENWRLYSVDLASGEERDLTPFEGVQAQIRLISPEFPLEAIIGLNKRNPQWHDVFQLNIATGELALVEENNQFLDYLLDEQFRMVCAFSMNPDGGIQVFKRSPAGSWEAVDSVPQADTLTTNPVGTDKSGQVVYMKDSRDRNTSALKAWDLRANTMQVLAEDPRVDVEDVVIHPTLKHVQAVSFVHARKRWQILDPSIQPDLELLGGVADGDVEVISRSLADRYWIVYFLVDDGPGRYYLYDRTTRSARFLFTNRAALEGLPLVKMHSESIWSRDGLELVLYYSLPPGSDPDGDGLPDQPVPMVFYPHGGPWGRDYWEYNPWHQWLANRGYAVMSVNFRSSTGFGKDFTNAGDRQWGEGIIQDQEDAVRWAIEQKIADPLRVAVAGGSFGGYSTLAGLTFTPELFACGVDMFGPVNLITLLESMPAYWKPTLEMFTTRVGDFRTEEGRALLKKHSPLTYVERICRPLLIGQGANDPRVKQAESDQIVKAMQAKGIPVTYVLYPDEGHGFARPENNLSFFAIAESFLSKCLGGRFEPVGEDFKGSSLQVLAGAGDVPGLQEALNG